jgi:glycine dehydrogenase subunit 2
MHSNLHKTFSTPHGWWGPGCGAIMVNEKLAPYLPDPYVVKNKDTYAFANHEKWIGKINDFHGQFWMYVRALAYIMANGKDGLEEVAEDSILSANYILHHLKNHYHIPFEGTCMHECLLTDKIQKNSHDITTLDIAKALIEYGYHPMTMYFPLTVTAAMLIEPTETESKATLDKFIKTMKDISADIKNNNGEKFKSYPLSTPRRRVDETKAAKTPILTWDEIQPKEEK